MRMWYIDRLPIFIFNNDVLVAEVKDPCDAPVVAAAPVMLDALYAAEKAMQTWGKEPLSRADWDRRLMAACSKVTVAITMAERENYMQLHKEGKKIE